MFFFAGKTSALLLDTGATEDSVSFPLQKIVDSLMYLFYKDAYANKHLIIAHTHNHSDHRAGDIQFLNKKNVIIVGLGLAEVMSFFNLKNWPFETQEYDLGDRVLDVLPIPGHEETSLAFFDRQTNLLFTGDTFYPGRLHVKNWSEFSSSVSRLVKFVKDHKIKYIVGNHIEMTDSNGRDFQIECTYQPFEHSLPLYPNDLEKLLEELKILGNSPKIKVCDNFIIYPEYQDSSLAEIPIEKAAVSYFKIDGYVDFLASDEQGVWVTNLGRVDKLIFNELQPKYSLQVPQPCGVLTTAFGSLWVANCEGNNLYRFNLKSNKLEAIISTGLADSYGELSIASSQDAIWLLTKRQGELSRVDPETDQVTSKIIVAPNSFTVAYGYEFLWIPVATDSLVQKVNPLTKKITSIVKVGKAPRFLTTGFGSIWTLNQDDGTVSRIDASTNQVTTIYTDLKGTGGDITASQRYVYVRAKKTLLTVIDPRTNKAIRSYGPPAGSGAVCVENGRIWVTSHDTNSIWVLREKDKFQLDK